MAIESLGTTLRSLPDVELPDLTGEVISVRAYAAGRPTVIVFACNHCPYVQSIETELGAIARDITDVAWLAVCSNDVAAYPQDDIEGLRTQVERAAWNFPYLVDRTQEVARTFGAVCTPDFFVFDGAGALVYRGAMDYARPRQPQPVDGVHLRAAVEAARHSRVYTGGKPAMGCGIKWKEDRPT